MIDFILDKIIRAEITEEPFGLKGPHKGYAEYIFKK